MSSNFYYIMSKDIGVGPELIGKLERLSKDDYQFRYLFGNKDKFPNIVVHIPDMDDTQKIYNTQETWHGIMRRVVPSKGSCVCEMIFKQHGLDLNKYNPWDYLDYLYQFYSNLVSKSHLKTPLHDGYERIYFYKEIPKKVNRYDKY